MTEDGPESAPGSTDGPDGVFGNLPSSRPGSRSPRRRNTDGEAAPEVAPETPEPVAVEPEPPSDAGSTEPGPEPTVAPKSVEDLAWAGVAVVAQAATAGIRFTSKALEAARKSIDRP